MQGNFSRKYSQTSLRTHSRKQRVLLTAALTKPYLKSSLTIITPLRGQLQSWKLFTETFCFPWVSPYGSFDCYSIMIIIICNHICNHTCNCFTFFQSNPHCKIDAVMQEDKYSLKLLVWWTTNNTKLFCQKFQSCRFPKSSCSASSLLEENTLTLRKHLVPLVCKAYK